MMAREGSSKASWWVCIREVRARAGPSAILGAFPSFRAPTRRALRPLANHVCHSAVGRSNSDGFSGDTGYLQSPGITPLGRKQNLNPEWLWSRTKG